MAAAHGIYMHLLSDGAGFSDVYVYKLGDVLGFAKARRYVRTGQPQKLSHNRLAAVAPSAE